MKADETEDDEPTSTDSAPGCCSVGELSSEAVVAADVETLSALGNDTRYEAVRRIAGADGEVCVCELLPTLGVSQGAVSQALSRLYTAGLVTRRKQGRWRYYGVTERAERLLAVLDETRESDDA